ncbi:MAG: TonB-dependent receptor, partial [Opitutaceae bacterium]
MIHANFSTLVRHCCRAAVLVSLFAGALTPAFAQTRKQFNVPPGPAAETLRVFAQQADREIVFSPATVKGVETKAVNGQLATNVALERLLDGTLLTAVEDSRTQAIAIQRQPNTSTSPAPSGANDAATAPAENPDGTRTTTIHGRVRNAAADTFLEGAEVEIQGTSRSTVTERDGSFTLRNVTVPLVLVVSYTGLDPRTVRVDSADDNLEILLGEDLIRLPNYVVSEQREGNAFAITQQRNAINVKEVVATDAFGSLRDGNVAELLVLLPGVVGEWVGNDIRTVQIRGFNANLGSVTVDGSKLANAESAGAERNFEFDALSADHIESVEVIKAPTPDMDADSIGGTVNLKTKSAFDYSDELRGSLSVGATYEDVRGTLLPNGSVFYSQIFGPKRNVGVSVNWGYSRHNVPRDGTQLLYPTTTGVPNYMRRIRLYDQENIRERTGGGLKLDFKLNEGATFFVNTLYSYFNEQIQGSSTMARRVRLQTNAAAVEPGFTDDRVEWRATRNTRAIMELIQTPKEEETMLVTAGGEHEIGSWSIDYDATASAATTHYDSRKFNRGRSSPELRNIGIILDRTDRDRSFPRVIQTSGPDIYDIANYTAGPLEHRDWRGEDDIRGAKLNIERRFAAPFEWSLQGGVKYRAQERTAYQRDRRWDYLGPDGEANSGDEGLARFTEDRSYRIAEGRYPAPRWLDLRAYSEALAMHPAWFEEDLLFFEENLLSNDREIEESVSAGYIMARARLFPQLSVLAGVRYEATEVEGASNIRQVSPEEAARRAAWAGPVTIEEGLRRIRAEYGARVRASADYDNVFPGVHLRYEPRRGLVLRASYSTAIGRPNFGSIIPDTDVDFIDSAVRTNNTDLKPQYARGIDLGAQYYF